MDFDNERAQVQYFNPNIELRVSGEVKLCIYTVRLTNYPGTHLHINIIQIKLSQMYTSAAQ